MPGRKLLEICRALPEGAEIAVSLSGAGDKAFGGQPRAARGGGGLSRMAILARKNR